MRIPDAVLSRVRGPALAVAMIGCSSGPAQTIEPVPAPEPETAAAVIAPSAPDPVDYDLDAETQRLEQADHVLAAAETRRARRIEAEEEAVRRRQRDLSVQILGIGRPDNQWIHAACGRG